MRRFTHTFPQRISAFLLCLALLVGLLPSAAFAAGTDTGKAIQLVDSGTAANIGGGQADNIFFGNYFQSNSTTKEPVKWRVLENADGQLFLLSDQNWMYFSIIRIMRASHGKRAPCAPGSMGTARSKTPVATAV